MTGTRVICMWSGPRNVSTAVMYSFAQRADTEVVDEPLYGHYLTVTTTPHPAEQTVVDAMNCDAQAVIDETIRKPGPRPVRFLKQMAHHTLGLELGFLAEVDNILLTRDPDQVIASLRHQIPNPGVADTGFDAQVRIAEQLTAQGRRPLVIDSNALLRDPDGMLRKTCAALMLDFDPAMLSWPPGPKPYDGVWAPWWYANVHQSTGFGQPRTEQVELPASLKPLAAQCRTLYERLLPYHITP